MWASRSLPAPDALLTLLTLVAVAGRGLTKADLATLTGHPPDEYLAAATQNGLGRRASRWTGATTYVVENVQQRQDILAAAGTVALAECGAALHAWAETYRELGWPASTPEYLLDGYFRFVESTGDVVRMAACATDSRRHERLLELTGGNRAARHEIVTCQTALAEHETPDLAAVFMLAVLRERLIRRDGPLPSSLPATVAASGDPARAEELVSAMTDPDRQTAALTSLALTLIDHGHLEQARHTLARLVTVVSTLDISDTRAASHPALASVADLTAAGQWTSAEQVACAITDRWIRASALRGLVSAQIADGHLDRAEHLALSITPGGGDDFDAEALTSVVSGLARSGQFDRAEALARTFPDSTADEQYGGILALPALTTALALAGEDEKLDKLILGTPDEQARSSMMAEAVMAVARSKDFDRAESLARAIPAGWRAREALAEVVNEMLVAGERDRAITLARSVVTNPPGTSPKSRQEPERPPEHYLNAVLSDRRRRGPTTPGPDKLVARALDQVDAGEPDRVERTIAMASTPFRKQQILCGIAAGLVERAMTDRAEQLAGQIDNRYDRAEVLAAVASASAAQGDVASARRLATQATTLARTDKGHDTQSYLSCAGALLHAGAIASAVRVVAHAVTIADTANRRVLSDIAVTLADIGTASGAKELARVVSFWSPDDDVADRLVATGELDRARLVKRDIGERQRAAILAAIESVMARPDIHDNAECAPPATTRGVPAVIEKAASLQSDRTATARLLADANAHADSAPGPDHTAAAWVRQLLARALPGVGDNWYLLLKDLAHIDPTAVRAIAQVIAPAPPVRDPAEKTTT